MLRDNIGKVLLEIYGLYFPHELKGSGVPDLSKESQKAMFIFLKDFDICPGIITKSSAFNIFVNDSNEVPIYTPTGLDIVTKIAKKDSCNIQFNKLPLIVGKCFTFFKFIDVIV